MLSGRRTQDKDEAVKICGKGPDSLRCAGGVFCSMYCDRDLSVEGMLIVHTEAAGE